MNAEKFSDAMSELDTKYVDEALNYKKKMKKPVWIKWGVMAACLCLIICVATIPRLLNGSNPPVSGDLAPMVYVNNKLYQYADSQPSLTDKESQFIYLGEIESKVSSSQEPKENFQANDDIVGAKVYQYENDIVILIDGKYFLYSNLENAENERIHTSYAQEKAILECVSNGDIHALENTYYSLPTTVYGKMTSSNSKLKLLFYASIANTTLVTRYAIEGGLNEETAFSLSDVYIRKMEQCTDVDALMKLNKQMAIEFTLRVAEAKKTPKNYYSPAISRVIDYIYHGKNKTLTLNQLASLVNLTPKYLSALFHKETGQTLTVFIHKVLVEKAQNLLAHSDYSLGEISTYLNFSSQSYFISIFKRYTGITPGQYRKLHRQISW